jgi:hypothetical protein
VVRSIFHELADRVRWLTLRQEPHMRARFGYLGAPQSILLPLFIEVDLWPDHQPIRLNERPTCSLAGWIALVDIPGACEIPPAVRLRTPANDSARETVHDTQLSDPASSDHRSHPRPGTFGVLTASPRNCVSRSTPRSGASELVAEPGARRP